MTQKEMPASFLGRQTFVINTNNPLITKIVSLEDKPLAKAMAEHLYDLSLLSQRELHPEALTPFINRSSEVLHKLVEHLR
jgi:molecular chaperone HtpG